MFSSAVRVGTRLNDWKTNPTWSRRSSVSSLSDRPAMSVSPMWISPELTVSSAARQCMRVDLPEPEGPITAVNSPASTSRETPSSARTWGSPVP